MLADTKAIFALLVLLVIVVALVFHQRTPSATVGRATAAGETTEQFGPPGFTGNFHALSAQLRGPCTDPLDYDQAAMSPLVQYRRALAGAKGLCGRGDDSVNTATESGYTTPHWRPEFVPTDGLTPVIGDTMGPALGPLIDLPSGEGTTGSSPAIPSDLQATRALGNLPPRWDIPSLPQSCLSGFGQASEACYQTNIPSWSQRPAGGDFYSPENGCARPAHELPYADQGGTPYSVGTITPTYNMLTEPDHEPLVGATTRIWGP